jgi:2-amino-4-hydroxy-6-hydroxymethyldihydropteridine diphosphokinase
MQAAKAYIGLGSNLGDSLAMMHAAIAALEKLPQSQLRKTSSFFKSAPYEASGNDFMNAVVAIDTTLSPAALLSHCQAIELAFGRERPFPNAPRTLDLDLLLYADEIINQASLSLPHPRMTERAFVLHPLLEIAPDITIPDKGLASDFLPSLSDQRIQKLLVEPISTHTR